MKPHLIALILLCATPPCLAGLVTNTNDSGPGSLRDELNA
jgi:hypothetical protein